MHEGHRSAVSRERSICYLDQTKSAAGVAPFCCGPAEVLFIKVRQQEAA